MKTRIDEMEALNECLNIFNYSVILINAFHPVLAISVQLVKPLERRSQAQIVTPASITSVRH